jgi:hypothetical protein
VGAGFAFFAYFARICCLYCNFPGANCLIHVHYCRLHKTLKLGVRVRSQ